MTPPPQPGPRASKLFPGAGHAILRSSGEKGLAAAFTFGPYGGFHGHLDKLSFVLFGYGRELGVDPGRAKSQAYRLPIHSRWYKATLGHNAVLVDGQSQNPATGKLEIFAASGRYSAVVARCDEAYPGVHHRRLLCLTPGTSSSSTTWRLRPRGGSIGSTTTAAPKPGAMSMALGNRSASQRLAGSMSRTCAPARATDRFGLASRMAR